MRNCLSRCFLSPFTVEFAAVVSHIGFGKNVLTSERSGVILCVGIGLSMTFLLYEIIQILRLDRKQVVFYALSLENGFVNLNQYNIMNDTYLSMPSDEDVNSGKYVFRDVFEVFDYIKSKGWSIGWYAAPYFEVMTLFDNHIVASPTPFSPLYRGQSSYYERCLPSLYRRPWNGLQKMERLVQIEDFKAILNDNPEIKDILAEGLAVNYIGLAQHYGIETNVIDLTNSFGVAAFFATSDYDSLTQTYWPVRECERKGVIYFMPMGIFNFRPTDDNQVWPIGMEALARPGEQRGFGAYLNEDQDFHSLCRFKFFFWQNAEVSIECQRRFGFGSVLFPYDPMAEKVSMMRKYRIYGKDSVRTVVDENPVLGYDFHTAIDSLTAAGCHILDSTPFRYTQDELNYITEYYHKKYPGSFLPEKS